MPRFSRRMGKARRSFVREILKVTEDPSIISFAGGLPNPRFFPVAERNEVTQLNEGGLKLADEQKQVLADLDR